MKKEKKKQRYRRRKKGPVIPMLLTAYNYKIIAWGVICVFVGFGGMFIEEQQFGFFSLYLAPLLILSGFVLVAISVFKTDPNSDVKVKEKTNSQEESMTSS